MNMVEFSNQIPSEQLIMIFKNFFEEHVATYDLLKGIQFIKINNITMDKSSIMYSVKLLDDEDKGKIVNDLIKNGHKVMMVGDGVNDSLALTSSTVGVGIAKGSDVALASSDFILMNNDLMDILTIFKLSKRIRNNINFNLIWAFGYNIIFIPIAAGVFSFAHIMLSPMYASMLMALSSVTVSLNSLTLFLFKDNYN